jgi:hypothetical protein
MAASVADALWGVWPQLTIICTTCVLLYALFLLIVSVELFYPSVKDRTTRLLCSSYTVAGVHSLVVSVLGIYETLTNDLMWQVRLSIQTSYTSSLYQYMCCFLIGYMLYDLVAMVTTPAIFRLYNYQFLFHHAVAICGSFVPGIRGLHQTLTMPFMIAEIPVVVVNFHSICKIIGKHNLNLPLTVLTALTFFIFRICIIPVLGIASWKYCYVENICSRYAVDAVVLFITYVSLSGLNTYWFGSAAFSLLFKSSKKSV